jgi:formylglycine-generating enzyme required for sulfatase activity
MRTRTWVAFWLLLSAAFAIQAVEPARVALVIGNGAYDSGALANPVNDAQLLRDTLQVDGFAVTYLANADRGQIVRAIQALGQQLTKAGQPGVGLFYFSGHGVQSRDGHNFLLPVRGHINVEADLLPEAVDADWVLKQMEEAGNGLNIVVLDACRNNPLPASTRSAAKGLAPMVAPAGSVVAFATRAGSVASDGGGTRNSPYAAALARYMQQPGLELKAMFDAVSHSVYEATKNAPVPQIPVQTYILTPTFYFTAAAVQPIVAASPAYDPRAAELALWQSVERIGTAEAYRAYLTQYPNGQFSSVAKLQLAALSRPVAGSGSSASSTASVVGGLPAPPLGVFRDCADCPEMVHIPAGSFLMGSAESETGREFDEGPQHRLQMPAFAIGKYAVTFAEWDVCVATGGCSKKPDDLWGRGRQPVIQVNWNDAQQYVRWLSTKTGHRYRLPSEAEWEYAARAGTTTAYYWGDDIGRGHADCSGCGSQWDRKQTALVGSFDPNPWGLYDMLGNVEQMTQDCLHDNYNGAPTDGSAWATGGDCTRRVARGGYWNFSTSQIRAAFRSSNPVDTAHTTTGFRVARTY